MFTMTLETLGSLYIPGAGGQRTVSRAHFNTRQPNIVLLARQSLLACSYGVEKG